MSTLPLDRWREHFGYDPLHFWQLAGPKAPVNSQCMTLVYEYAWQNAQRAGRSDIRRAIDEAERKLRDTLGYRVSPAYVETTLPWPRLADTRLQRFTPIDSRLHYLSVQLHEGFIRAIGAEALASQGDAPVTLLDRDGDGVPDAFSATLIAPTAPTADAEVVAYFVAADRYDGSALGPRWEIEPISVTITGNQITVTGASWLLVKPILYQRRRTQPDLDAANAANYAADIELAIRSTDAAQAGYVRWEQPPYPTGLNCCAGPGTQSFDGAELRDARRGVVAPILPSSALGWAWWAGMCREPDTVTLRYRAGVEPTDDWRTVIARLAAAELALPICACDGANQELYTWQFDLSRAAGKMDEQFQISGANLDCPWGTRRGHVYAWHMVNPRRQMRAHAV